MNRTESNRTRWTTLLMTLAFALSLGALALNQSATAQEEDETPMVKHMTGINDGYKLLRRAARSGDLGEETLAAVLKMQKHTLEAKALTPPIAAKLSGDAKEKMLNGYRMVMAKLLGELANLEVAIRKADAEAAKKSVSNLALIKKEGHDAFIEDE